VQVAVDVVTGAVVTEEVVMGQAILVTAQATVVVVVMTTTAAGEATVRPMLMTATEAMEVMTAGAMATTATTRADHPGVPLAAEELVGSSAEPPEVNSDMCPTETNNVR